MLMYKSYNEKIHSVLISNTYFRYAFIQKNEMKKDMKKIFLILLITMSISVSSKCQSIYYMQYRYTSIADTTLYHVFLVAYEDGTGFYRVSFYDELSKDNIVVDLEMEEKYLIDNNGNEDRSKIYFRGSNPQIVYGDKDYHYYPERFWFKIDPNTGYYEPWAVTSPDEKGTAQGKYIEPPLLLEQTDLTEDFVSNFFSKDEEFYKNLFTVTQRSLTPEQKKAKLHLIIVANTEDETIGSTCTLDKDRTLKTFKDLSEFLGIGFASSVIFGNNYNKQNVLNAVSTLTPQKNDIVIFYYSGHGYKDENNVRQFPNMILTTKSFENVEANSVNVEDVYNSIRNKGARFNLVFSDCCNNGPNDRATITCDVPRTRTSTIGWSLENCKALFMNNKPMSIIMTAAQKGEMSTGNLTFGGFFTNQFRSNLTTYFGPFHQFPTWNTILEESKKTTTDQAETGRCSASGEPLKTYKQHPFYKIH